VKSSLEEGEGGEAVGEDRERTSRRGEGGIKLKGRGDSTKFSAKNGVGITMACRVNQVDFVVSGWVLVGRVERGAGAVRVRFVGAVSIVGVMCYPAEGGSWWVEGGGLSKRAGEGSGKKSAVGGNEGGRWRGEGGEEDVRKKRDRAGVVLDMDQVKGGGGCVREVVREMGGGREGEMVFVQFLEVSSDSASGGDRGEGGGEEGVGLEREDEDGVGGEGGTGSVSYGGADDTGEEFRLEGG